jgi:hypothetical protein
MNSKLANLRSSRTEIEHLVAVDVHGLLLHTVKTLSALSRSLETMPRGVTELGSTSPLVDALHKSDRTPVEA